VRGIGLCDLPSKANNVGTYIPAAIHQYADNLALLYLCQGQLGETFTSIDIILYFVSVLTNTNLTGLTSLLMSTTNILRRTSVFIPCFLASLSSELSSTSSSRVFDARFELSCRSTRGSPFQAAPTSHHFPLVSAECRSSKVTRRGSCATTEQCSQPYPTARKDEMTIQCRVLLSPVRNFFKRSVTSPPACCVAARLTLLFFKFINVSNMKRVLEL
jgi:hypothetical protein